MNGRERILAHLAGKPVDRLPLMPITMQFACDRIGANYHDYESDCRVLVEGQMRVAEQFDFDYVNTMSDPAREAADCGAVVEFFDNAPAAMVEEQALLADKTNLAKLKAPDPLGGGRMHNAVKAVALLKEKLRGEKLIEGWIEGPIAEAADLRGINTLMLDFYDDPAFVRDLFEFVVGMELRFARAQVDAGVDLIGVGDAAASLVGPQIYEEFVWPYEKKLVDGLHALGTHVRLHVCGNTRFALAGMGRLGCEIVDLDFPSPIAEGRAKMGAAQVLLGNINPVTVLRGGTPERVFNAIAECHYQAGARYIVGAGCEVPRDTPPENVRALAEYAHSHKPAQPVKGEPGTKPSGLMHTCRLIALCVGLLFPARQAGAADAVPAGGNPLRPVVEMEDDVYTYEPADNGAGPMWCAGSTCLVRIGEDVFASGLETIKDAKPLNNCRWMLFKRGPAAWEKVRLDDTGRTREPCPLAAFPDGRLFLSANPTLAAGAESGGGPARPELLQFSASHPQAPFEGILPVWSGTPRFTEHSYRSLAADAANRELILFQNIDYTHAEWTFRDRGGKWSAQGQLKWPWGADYDTPQPIRVCYPTVALKDRAVYFCGVSDIVEPHAKWREFKKQLTGKDWDYDFRRLFFAWTPDITTGKFRDWIEVASRDKTAGWLFPADLCVTPGGDVHLLWTERAIDERLREKFFPEAKQSHALNYAVVRDGKVVSRRTLVQGGEGLSGEMPSAGRFQVTSDNRLFVFYYVSGKDAAGKPVSENRLMELRPGGAASESVRVPLKVPFTSFFTATARAGSPPSNTLELLGQRVGQPLAIGYARIRL